MKKVVIIFGPPGSGKSVTAKYVADQLGLKHISTGDILRKSGRTFGVGNLASDDEVIAIVRHEITGQCVLDGFPRTIKQAIELERMIKVDAVILLDGDVDVFADRAVKRGKVGDRADDAEDVVMRRMYEYMLHTSHLVNHYRDVVIKVDATRTLEEVQAEVLKIVDSIEGEEEPPHVWVN